MQSLDMKAELRDPAIARAICEKLGAAHAERVEQTDEYYRIPDARLKKRTTNEGVEYIFYTRVDRAGTRLNQFTIYDEQAGRDRFGSISPPVVTTVRKVRDVYQYRNGRIHLDDVEGLGTFIEFEALITPERDVVTAHKTLDDLWKHFRPVMGEVISASYSELVEQTKQ